MPLPAIFAKGEAMIRLNGFFTKGCLTVLVCLLLPSAAYAGSFKVFAVMSYDRAYEWSAGEKAGIDEVLGDTCKVEYFYLDTRKSPEKGEHKAEEAFERYRDLRPHGVIAADDNAQSLFVVPYLKDKVETPVMFCGVNADPEKYGYPSENVSGILERLHIAGTIAFARQLMPSIRTFAFISRDTPTTRLARRQLRSERGTYEAQAVAFRAPGTLEEALRDARQLAGVCDALFYESMEGIPDSQNRRLTDPEVLPMVVDAFGKPVLANESYHVRHGALCGVVKSGREQGAAAAKMLLEAMRGTPVADIPMTRNRRGVKMVNAAQMKEFGIRPEPGVLEGVEVVR
jgi:ABC-type uncharacterized transport system substrate-binding protein